MVSFAPGAVLSSEEPREKTKLQMAGTPREAKQLHGVNGSACDWTDALATASIVS